MTSTVEQVALSAAGASWQHLMDTINARGPVGDRIWLAESVTEALRIYVAELRRDKPAEVPRG